MRLATLIAKRTGYKEPARWGLLLLLVSLACFPLPLSHEYHESPGEQSSKQEAAHHPENRAQYPCQGVAAAPCPQGFRFPSDSVLNLFAEGLLLAPVFQVLVGRCKVRCNRLHDDWPCNRVHGLGFTDTCDCQRQSFTSGFAS